MILILNSKCKTINITQEIEFSRKVESVAIWHKSVVSLILWVDVINGQFVVPTLLFRSLVH